MSGLAPPVAADCGRTRVSVAFRVAERSVPGCAAAARMAKRRGRCAATGGKATDADGPAGESPLARRVAHRTRRFGGRAAAAQPVSVVRPQAKTAIRKSLSRV